MCVCCSVTISPVLRDVDILFFNHARLQFLLGSTASTGRVVGGGLVHWLCFLPGSDTTAVALLYLVFAPGSLSQSLGPALHSGRNTWSYRECTCSLNPPLTWDRSELWAASMVLVSALLLSLLPCSP